MRREFAEQRRGRATPRFLQRRGGFVANDLWIHAWRGAGLIAEV
jgi:hypothetical protein